MAEGPAEEEEEVLSMQSGESRGRGRPAIPICWSRVLHVTAGTSIQVKAHQVAVDIMVQQQLRAQNRASNSREWKMVFHPKAFAQLHEIESSSG